MGCSIAVRNNGEWMERPRRPTLSRIFTSRSCSYFYLLTNRRGLQGQIMNREIVVAITDGELDFGPWERVFYGKFDGRRKKRVLVKIIGE